MRRAGRFLEGVQAGWILLELLLCCVLLGILSLAAVPAAREMYLKAAVEYETECLYSEIRQLQVMSRTVSRNEVGPDTKLLWENKPSLAIDKYGYYWKRQSQKIRTHECLPGVEIAVQGTLGNSRSVVSFSDWGKPDKRLMTIEVFASGKRPEGRHIVISNGRVRLERGS